MRKAVFIVVAFLAMTVNAFSNGSYFSTTPAAVQITPDYFLSSDLSHGITFDTEQFGCTSSGCNATKVWEIIEPANCSQVTLSVSVVETDFSSSSEYVYVYVNDKFLASCEPLDEDCSYDWIQCSSIQNLDVSSHLTSSANHTYLSLKLAASDEVGICPYYANGVSNYLFGSATVTCIPTNATWAPTAYPSVEPTIPTPQPTQPSVQPTDAPVTPDFQLVQNSKITSDTEYLGCTTDGCSVSKVWEFHGQCEQLKLSVAVVETDFASESEQVEVFVNGAFLTSCEPLNQDCTNDWVTCTNPNSNYTQDSYDVTSLVTSSRSGGAEVSVVEIKLDASYDVNYCEYYNPLDSTYYTLFASVTIECIAPDDTNITWAPTSEPTGSPTHVDVVWVVPTSLHGASTVTEDTRQFTCTSSGCSVSKMWRADGVCDTVMLSVAFRDLYSSCSNDLVGVLVNDEIVGQCDGTSSSCTKDWTACTGVTNHNISSFFDTSASTNYLSVTLQTTDVASYCWYYANSTYYYLYGNVTISCYQNYQFDTQTDTQQNCSAAGLNNVTLKFKYGYQPSETSFKLYQQNADSASSKLIFSGDGGCAYSWEDVSKSACIADGCYYLVVNDTYGRMGYNDIYGSFSVMLNGEVITLQNQTFDGTSSVFTFCTDLFSSPSVDSANRLDLDLYGVNFNMMLTGSDGATLYSTQYGGWNYVAFAASSNLLINPDYCLIITISDISSVFSSYYLKLYWNAEHVVQTDYGNSFRFSPCNATLAPSPVPTGAPTILDYTFNTSAMQNGTQSDTQYFGCSVSGCNVTKVWLIQGVCEQVYLSVSAVETDYASTSEKLFAYVNGHRLGECDDLDEDCSHDWVTCNTLTNVDVSSYLTLTQSTNYLSLMLDITDDVGYCSYYVDGTSYYMYANATITCVGGTLMPSAAPSKGPSDAPSPDPTGAPSKAPFEPLETSAAPTKRPSEDPTDAPSGAPTDRDGNLLSLAPTAVAAGGTQQKTGGSGGSGSILTNDMVVAGACVIGAILLVVVAVCVCRRRAKKKVERQGHRIESVGFFDEQGGQKSSAKKRGDVELVMKGKGKLSRGRKSVGADGEMSVHADSQDENRATRRTQGPYTRL